MYGVLLVRTATGKLEVLQGFSGLLGGRADWLGWVPPIPGRAQVALAEAATLNQLDRLKGDLLRLQNLPERADFAQLCTDYDQQLMEMATLHKIRKAERDRLRAHYAATLTGAALETALATLVRQSQQDGGERRRLKTKRKAAIAPLAAAIAAADRDIQQIKHRRKALSQTLQRQMHTAYCLTNFAGNTVMLQELWPNALPTGTGDCAAPKLLHYAATRQYTPLALAEFWWGAAEHNKQPGQFYGACRDRCQPIMGFLLSGLSPLAPDETCSGTPSLTILYEDDHLLVVDKPSGLLSVPGRTHRLQDSVLSRLRRQRGEHAYLAAGHRLDKGTSGVFLLAKSESTHRTLNQQFAQRQVHKVYEAVLSRAIAGQQGTIDLPLWRDPRDRPKQSVHIQLGKPSLTEFHVLASGATPRLRLYPHTGRTHQLRVHTAHPDGLNAPIMGDTLYGYEGSACRLHLHAHQVSLQHPVTQTPLRFSSPVPF